MKKLILKPICLIMLALLLFSTPAKIYAGNGIESVEFRDSANNETQKFAPGDEVVIIINLTDPVSETDIEIQQRYTDGPNPIIGGLTVTDLRDVTKISQEGTQGGLQLIWPVIVRAHDFAPDGVVSVKIKVRGAGFVRTGYLVE